ncbi:MAG: guanylate kinase [Waddliaceae bacterium]
MISAPSGTGKTTLADRLTVEFPDFIRSLSWTTREAREGETDGVDYVFVTEEQFLKGIKEGEFLEYAKIYGYYYGTSQKWVEERLNQGQHVLLVIDTQGAMQVREKTDAVLIFIQPPSLEELERRLRGRETEEEEAIQKRLKLAKHELKLASEYDYYIVNDDLEVAYQELKKILTLEGRQ